MEEKKMMEIEEQRKIAYIKAEELIEIYFESKGESLAFKSTEEIEYYTSEYEKYVFKKWNEYKEEKKAKKEKYEEEYMYFAFNYIENIKKYAKYKENDVIEKDKKDLYKKEKAMLETLRGKKKKPQIRQLTAGNLAAYSRLMRKIIFGWTDIYSLNFNNLEEIVEENKTQNVMITTDAKKVEDAIFEIQKKIFGIERASVLSGKIKKLI